MLHVVAIAQLLASGVTTAAPVPARAERLELNGGVGVAGAARLGIPVAPYLTGGVSLVHGLGPRVDVGLRYTTALFAAHTLSLAWRMLLARVGVSWSFGLVARADVRVYAVPLAPAAVGGDALVAPSLRVTLHTPRAAVTLEAGASVQLVAFDASGQRTLVDRRPTVGSVDAGLAVEWAGRGRGAWLFRFDLGWVPLRGDPFALFGFHPRVAFGGSWGM